jgi:hypothetical protein
MQHEDFSSFVRETKPTLFTKQRQSDIPNKNAQIFTTVRLAQTLFLELICFKIIAERFVLLKINQSKR